MRKLRDLILAGLVGGLLVLGGTALADVPDATPSVVDPTHTFYVCVAPNITPYKNLYALDKSQGTGQCPSGWAEKHLAPVVLQGG